MTGYIARRLLGAIPVLWGVATLVFVVMRLLPGDPAALMLSEAGGSAEAISALQEELGFDEPLLVQYGQYLLRLLQGDLGVSLFSHRPVVTIIAEQLPSTIALAAAAMLVAVCLGIALGLVAAAHHRTWLDRLATTVSATGVSVPVFWSALLLIWLLSLQLDWLPATGQGGLAHLFMPALVLGFASAGAIARLVRASLLEVMDQDFVRTARAKGLRESTLLFRHTLKNALIPIVTVIGNYFAMLMAGAIITEKVFSWPGLGSVMINAIEKRDMPVVMGSVLVLAMIFVLTNIVVDISYAYIDPRVRLK